MRSRSTFALITVGLLLGACGGGQSAQPHAGGEAPHWSYEGATGPEHWGDLDPAWEIAKTGQRQSPIDIETALAETAALPEPSFSYEQSPLTIENNGHTIEVVCAEGSSLTVGDRTFALAQFHFHAPSEHTIDGRHTEMELHLVHKDADGRLGVIGVLIEQGGENAALEALWQHLPTEAGPATEIPGAAIDARDLLPDSRAHFAYSGSLTTPPCSEDVQWYVLRQPIRASAAQIATFRELISTNNRPTQPRNDRDVQSSE